MKIVLLWILIAAIPGLAWSVEIKESLEARLARYADKPGSCEYAYYSLFKNPAPKTTIPFASAYSGLEKDFETSKNTMSTLLSQEIAPKQNLRSKNLFLEWARRVRSAKLFIDTKNQNELNVTDRGAPESLLAIPSDYIPQSLRRRPLLGNSFFGNNIYSSASLRNTEIEDETYISAEVMVKLADIAGRSPTATVTMMSHELAHSLYWVPESWRKCLNSSDSVGGRQESANISDNFASFRNEFTEKGLGAKSGAGTEAVEFFEELAKTGKTKVAGELVTIMDRLSKDNRKPTAAEAQRFATIVRELYEAYPKKSLSPTQELQRQREIRATEQEMRTERRQGELALLKERLANLKDVQRLDRMKFIDSIFKAQPQQVTEAVADLAAVKAAVFHIDQNIETPEERKAAVQDLLKIFEPSLYTAEVDTLISRVGAKKTNETRIFRIFMADPKIREWLGCEMAEPVATNCPVEFAPSPALPIKKRRTVVQ